MKNQYVGDERDFYKYSLLNELSGNGVLSKGICWMLTPNNSKHGQHIGYLKSPLKWRHYAPQVFDALEKCVGSPQGRNIKCIENSGIFSNTRFYSDLLSDDLTQRNNYFQAMKNHLKDTELVFFDPDNGLEVDSCLKGRRNSSKYLYWDELADVYTKEQHSVLVYQHKPRENPDAFLDRIDKRIKSVTNAPEVFIFRVPGVYFFLVSQPRHVNYFDQQATKIVQTWNGHIQRC